VLDALADQGAAYRRFQQQLLATGGQRNAIVIVRALTAPFVYARIMGTTDKQAQGYAKAALDQWTERAKTWAAGGSPDDLQTFGKAAAPKAASRDVFLYVISGFKERNPAAAIALIDRLKE